MVANLELALSNKPLYRELSRLGLIPARHRQVAMYYEHPSKGRPRGRHSGSRIAKLGASLLILVALVCSAPWIIANTPLKNHLLAILIPEFGGQLTVGKISLLWHRPPSLSELVLTDADGQTVFEIDELSTNRRLWEWVCQTKELGTVRLLRPRLFVMLDDKSSNLERLWDDLKSTYQNTPPINNSSEKTATPVITFEIVDGIATTQKKGHPRQWTIDQLNARIHVNETGSLEAVKAVGNLAGFGKPGNWQLQLGPANGKNSTLQSNEINTVVPQQQLILQLTNIPIDAMDPLIQRNSDRSSFSGRLQGKIVARWKTGKTSSSYEIGGHLTATQITIEDSRLNGDVLQLSQAHLAGNIELLDDVVSSRGILLETDLGTINVGGTLDLAQLNTMAFLEGILHQQLQINTIVDVAELATHFPRTLRIRAGLQMQSGKLEIGILPRGNDSAGTNISLTTSDWVAEENGQEVHWRQPFEANLSIHWTEQGTTIDQFNCQADFLGITARRTGSQTVVQGRCDLNELAGKLRQFIDFRGIELSGRGAFDCLIKQAGQGHTDIHGKLHAEDFAIGWNSWKIDEPNVQIDSRFSWDSARSSWTSPETTVSTTSLAVRGENVRLQMENKGSPTANGSFVFRADLDRLSRWLINSKTLREQRCEGQVTGQVRLSHAEHKTKAMGTARIQSLKFLKRQALSTAQNPQIHEVAHHEADDWDPVWFESDMTITAEGELDHHHHSLKIDRLQLSDSSIGCDLSGEVRHWNTSKLANLEGEVEYNWQILSHHLRKHLNISNLSFQGKVRQPFHIMGSLNRSIEPTPPMRDETSDITQAKPLTGQIGIAWENGYVYGLTLGPGETTVRFNEQTIHFSPLDVAFSDGRLRCTGRIALDRTPYVLDLNHGTLLENVRISPEMCKSWLKYIAPTLAEATRIDGRLSVALNHFHIPLDDVRHGDILGTLFLHHAQLLPGPAAEPFVLLAGQALTLVNGNRTPDSTVANSMNQLTVQSQKIPFHMSKGGVQHQNMQIMVGKVGIKTSGWVGFDQSLYLKAELPISNRWLPRTGILASLQDRVIEIPVRGSLTQPRLDQRAVEQLAKNLLGDSTQQLLENAVFDGLDRLFPSRP